MIGGNHEASNYMRELYYGGWVAENIYYLGTAGVIDVVARTTRPGGEGAAPASEAEVFTIGGVSGIEKSWDYQRGLYELPPFDHHTVKSIYHYRQYETEKFKLFKTIQERFRTTPSATACEIFMSHEWPQLVTDPSQAHPQQIKFLLKKKKHFKQDIQNG